MYHEIKGIIYRVNFQYGSCFVECDEENAQEELYHFCAKKAASGKVISSRQFCGNPDSLYPDCWFRLQ